MKKQTGKSDAEEFVKDLAGMVDLPPQMNAQIDTPVKEPAVPQVAGSDAAPSCCGKKSCGCKKK